MKTELDLEDQFYHADMIELYGSKHMGETSHGEAFRNKHGHNNRYRLMYFTAGKSNPLLLGEPEPLRWYWDQEHTAFTNDIKKATSFYWEDLENAGNRALHYTMHHGVTRDMLKIEPVVYVAS